MTCERMKDLVHAYLDDELSLTEQLSFEQHLATCPECEQAQRTFTQLHEQLQTSGMGFELPADLRQSSGDCCRRARSERGECRSHGSSRLQRWWRF